MEKTMSELYPSDSLINALSGTKDAEQEVQYPAIYESPYYTTFYKMLYRTLDVARRAGDFRVFKDGSLTFGVRAGKFNNGATTVTYNGASGVSLTDNATNSIYISSDGSLSVSTSGFPAVAVTPHIPLAEITASGGEYDFDDIVDLRGRGIYGIVTAMTAQNSNTLTGSNNADTLHVHGGNGIENLSVNVQHLAENLRDMIPSVILSAVDNQDGTASITVQVTDGYLANLLANSLVKIWTTSLADLSPSAEAELDVNTGQVLNTVQSDVCLEVISNSSGLISIEATSATSTTFTVVCGIGSLLETCAVTITVP